MQEPICLITATCGRNYCVSRVLRCFLDQDYTGDHLLLIYNNSPVSQELALDFSDLPENKKVILINNHIDLVSKEPYTNLGAIYTDILEYIPEKYQIIAHADDDDLYLPYHVSEGMKGMEKAKEFGKRAYKPAKSYYRDSVGIHLMSNTLEPSIFVNRNILEEIGYKQSTSDQHLQWVDFLRDNDFLLVSEEFRPTLCYNWGDMFPTWKTSGDPNNPFNFANYRSFSTDHGSGRIYPVSKKEINEYYKEIIPDYGSN